MMKRILPFGFCAKLVLLVVCATSLAAEPRETPLVRAIKRARPSVVNIHSEKTAYSGDNLFGSGRGRKVNGMGTGIVLDERGYIVTNYHVVHGVDTLQVTLDDGSTYTARVISFDRQHDLAVIKVDPSKKLQAMPLGTSSDLMLGETVVAIGNAFGYNDTVTAGIISSLSRDVEVNETQSYKNLIQTDASINPGNSGGPLINLNGEVIGINVAIRAGAQRIGFAIPIDDARKVIAKLLSVEKLGNTFHGLKSEDVKKGKLRQLVVDSATPDSPAAEAGFLAGDVVVKAGDVDVIDAADFERALLEKSAGKEIAVVVRRDEEMQTLTLKLSERTSAIANASETETVIRANNEETLNGRVWKVLGVHLAPLPRTERKLVGSRYRGGMRVLDVRPGSTAQLNGIHGGDILVGLHIWETVNQDNVLYVLDHPRFSTFSPLKFYIVRKQETLYGHLEVASRPK